MLAVTTGRTFKLSIYGWRSADTRSPSFKQQRATCNNFPSQKPGVILGFLSKLEQYCVSHKTALTSSSSGLMGFCARCAKTCTAPFWMTGWSYLGLGIKPLSCSPIHATERCHRGRQKAKFAHRSSLMMQPWKRDKTRGEYRTFVSALIGQISQAGRKANNLRMRCVAVEGPTPTKDQARQSKHITISICLVLLSVLRAYPVELPVELSHLLGLVGTILVRSVESAELGRTGQHLKHQHIMMQESTYDTHRAIMHPIVLFSTLRCDCRRKGRTNGHKPKQLVPQNRHVRKGIYLYLMYHSTRIV